MKHLLIGLFALGNALAFASEAKLSFAKYLTCHGNNLKVTIYQDEKSDEHGLILLEINGQAPLYTTTKSSLLSHGFRFHSNSFNMNFDFYEEGKVKTILVHKNSKYVVECDLDV